MWIPDLRPTVIAGCVFLLSLFASLVVFSVPGRLTVRRSQQPDVRALRACDLTAPSAPFVEGSSNGDTLHIAFMAVLSVNPSRMRLAVLDVLRQMNTSAFPDVVVHIFTDDLGDTYRTALPQCDGLSVNLIDIGRAAEVVDVPRFCSAFGLATHEPGCFYLTKPLWYRWMPAEVDAMLVLDADVRVLGDVRELLVTELAAQRAAGAPFGLAAENLPAYAPTIGSTGVNDLRAMRVFAPALDAFVSSLGPESDVIEAFSLGVARCGDQSLLTYLNTTKLGQTGGSGGRPVLRLLPCTWNVQLCMGTFTHDTSGTYFARFPWVHVSSCKGKPRLVHGNCGTYDAHRLDQWDDPKLVAIVNRVKAVGFAAPAEEKTATGGPILETLGQYGSGSDDYSSI